MNFARIAAVGCLLLVFGVAGCGQKDAANDTNTNAAATTSTGGTYFDAAKSNTSLSDSTYTVAGVSFTPPTNWRDEGSSMMRKAQLATGPDDGDTDSATVVVFYFGPDQGGAAQANITRWIGQMGQPDGSSSNDKAHQFQTELGGMKAHVVELTGTYTAGGMGMGQAVTLEGYLMVAVVLEGPEGSVFFKLTGPEKTASRMAAEFAQMMNTVSKASM